MKVVVLGSTGVLGRNVLPRLRERGHLVRAVARRPEQIQPLERMGMEDVLGDILRPDTLTGATAGCDVVLHLATAIPRAGRPQDWNLNDRIRREGTRNLLAACQANRISRYVQQSITLLYGDCGSNIVDETQPLNPIPLVESAFDMEGMVQQSSTDWCILRAGLLYGPGTWREEAWRQEARAGQLSWYGQGDAFMSLIHVADLAKAVVQAVESASSHSIYNVVDDRPVTCRDLYRYIAASVGALEPSSGSEPHLLSLGCSNRKIHADLGWDPSYPTFQSGLAM
jgi:nucleoside-diphosphate-sugar epimerase